jgi:polysaccharide export outer membrane protein
VKIHRTIIKKASRFALIAVLPVVGIGFGLPGQDAAPQNPTTQAETRATEKVSSQAAESAKAAKVPAADDNTFVMGPEDQIEITVWADNRIGGPYLVRPDGRISMPLLGDVQAAGRTPLSLASDIGDLLKQKDIIRRPEVNVKLLQVRSRKYMINGEVLKTGEFPLASPTRVMDALVNAGGFKDFANKKDIVIIRGAERLKFNWNEVVKGKKTDQNVFVQPGDIIIVK